MKKYFLMQKLPVVDSPTSERIFKYKNRVMDEMVKMGATPQELSLLRDATILNSIRKNRSPEDVAWALLQ